MSSKGSMLNAMLVALLNAMLNAMLVLCGQHRLSIMPPFPLPYPLQRKQRPKKGKATLSRFASFWAFRYVL